MASTLGFQNTTLSHTQQLYADVDFDGLNVAERLWGASLFPGFLVPRSSCRRSICLSSFTAQWYLYFDNPVIATGLMSFLMHEVRRRSALLPCERKEGSPFPFFALLDRLLRSLPASYHHRPDSLLPQVEASAGAFAFSPCCQAMA